MLLRTITAAVAVCASLVVWTPRARAQAPGKQAASNPANVRYRRSSQRQPTPDRYKEIQQALADRGYLSNPPDGKWGPESAEAVRRFQRDENLVDDGKLGALTLRALGLGPRRAESAATLPVKAAPAPLDE